MTQHFAHTHVFVKGLKNLNQIIFSLMMSPGLADQQNLMNQI